MYIYRKLENDHKIKLGTCKLQTLMGVLILEIGIGHKIERGKLKTLMGVHIPKTGK